LITLNSYFLLKQVEYFGDFLSDRRFFVERDKKRSPTFTLELGCVQGSVLGPILFNMYLNDLPNVIGGDLTATYADDTYVVVSDSKWEVCERKVNVILRKHMEFLKNRGMVSNPEKTELMVFNGPQELEISLDGNKIKASEAIKALGVTLDNKIKWDKHIDKQVCRVTKILNGIKIVKNKFDMDQIKKIVTAQVFSILYYCDIVWLNPNLGYTNYKKLNKVHYSALRIITGDYRRIMSKKDLNKLTQRLPPRAWAHYSASSFFIKMCRSKSPTNLWMSLQPNLYHNARHLNPTVQDRSRMKIGKKIIQNWIGTDLAKLNFKWFEDVKLTDYTIRVNLKRLFYTENFS